MDSWRTTYLFKFMISYIFQIIEFFFYTCNSSQRVCIVIIVKSMVIWPRITSIRKAAKVLQKRRGYKEKTLQVKIQMILEAWCLWLQFQMSMSTPRSGSSTQASQTTWLVKKECGYQISMSWRRARSGL